jgi:hypothetical protein
MRHKNPVYSNLRKISAADAECHNKLSVGLWWCDNCRKCLKHTSYKFSLPSESSIQFESQTDQQGQVSCSNNELNQEEVESSTESNENKIESMIQGNNNHNLVHFAIKFMDTFSYTVTCRSELQFD